MIYGIKDDMPLGKVIMFGVQMTLSVFVATVLIANICGVAVSGALLGAGLATLAYLITTKCGSPMFISNSGAFVAPVMMALAAGGYGAVAVGGIVTCVVYCLFGFIFYKINSENIYKVFPKALIGAVTVTIGITLMGFINTYVQINGETNIWGVVICMLTALIIALISHYAKGIAKVLPFLIGTLAGYGMAVILTLTGTCKLIDFSFFQNLKFLSFPDVALGHWTRFDFKQVVPVIIVYVAYTISAMMECLSDTAALGGIVGEDLYKNPGLHRIFIGEGIANLLSSAYGGLGACSYGESIACIGFSKVASVRVTGAAALMLIIMSYLNPIQVFVSSIPSCVFGGCALILYGYIACSGVKMLQGIDLNDQKNLVLVSVVLSIGISGIAIGGSTFALSGTALALIAGVVLNLVLKEKDTDNG